MAVQSDNGDFGDIIDRVYRAATGETRWEDVLKAITDITGSNYSFFQEHDLSTYAMTRFWHDQCPVERLTPYVEELYQIDPRIKYAQKYPREEIYNDYKIMGGEDSINNDPFYNEFFSEIDVRYHAASSIIAPSEINGTPRIAYFGFCRRQSKGHATQQECEFLINLRPHIERALTLESKLGIANTQADLLRHTLDTIAYGIIIVDGTATIKWANEKARRVLAERDGIASEKGVLAASAALARKQLRSLIASACQTLVDPRRQPGGALLIPREFATPIELLVAPLPSDSAPIAGLVNELRNCAVCFLYERDQRRLSSENAIRALFGLTQSEAQLANELANGASLKDAADARGITYESARTQLKVIYSKTDTHTQSQLVSLVLRSPASLVANRIR